MFYCQGWSDRNQGIAVARPDSARPGFLILRRKTRLVLARARACGAPALISKIELSQTTARRISVRRFLLARSLTVHDVAETVGFAHGLMS
eukprot:2846366-Prymnesium_polylepis.2